MNDTEALVIVIAVITAPYWLPRILPRALHVWRICRCGAEYCIGCGRRGK